jgi:hypothetical protein
MMSLVDDGKNGIRFSDEQWSVVVVDKSTRIDKSREFRATFEFGAGGNMASPLAEWKCI